MNNPFGFMKQLFGNNKETTSESIDVNESIIDVTDDAFIDVENVQISRTSANASMAK